MPFRPSDRQPRSTMVRQIWPFCHPALMLAQIFLSGTLLSVCSRIGLSTAAAYQRQHFDVDCVITGDYKTCPAPNPGSRGPYPRPCHLSVLKPEASQIKVYDPEHVAWCIDQFMGADPDLGGEETLDLDIVSTKQACRRASFLFLLFLLLCDYCCFSLKSPSDLLSSAAGVCHEFGGRHRVYIRLQCQQKCLPMTKNAVGC